VSSMGRNNKILYSELSEAMRVARDQRAHLTDSEMVVRVVRSPYGGWRVISMPIELATGIVSDEMMAPFFTPSRRYA
jgi:hypothetical protein